MKNGLLSGGGEQRKLSVAALRWSSVIDELFGKLTCHLPSSQMCKTTSKKTFSSFDISSTGFENLLPPELASKPFSHI